MQQRTQRSRRLGTGVAALAATAAFAPAAHAGIPTVLGNVTQGRPTVTAGPEGVYHVAFNDEGSKLITYCQVTAALATASGVDCAKRTLIPFSDPTGDVRPEVPWVVRNPDDGTLYLAMQNYLIDEPSTLTNHAWVWSSIDDGTTWVGPTRIHQRGTGTNPSRPILGPTDGVLSFASWNTELTTFSAPINGSGAVDESFTTLGTGGKPGSDFGGGLRIAPFGSATVAASDTLEEVYSWVAEPAANLSNAATWSGPTVVDKGNESTIAGADGRTNLSYVRKSDGRLVARAFKGGTGASAWGDPVVVNPEQPVVTTAVADQNVSPGGKFILGYRENGRGLRVSLSDDGGAWETKTIAASDEVFFDLNVARDDAGDGLAVWTRSGAIVASSLTSVRSPSSPKRTVSVEHDGRTFGLNLEGSCVLAGKKTTLTVGGQGKGKITKVAFSLGKQKRTVDSSPFKASFTVPKKAVDGADLPVKARISHALTKGGKTTTKTRTITSSLEVCGG